MTHRWFGLCNVTDRSGTALRLSAGLLLGIPGLTNGLEPAFSSPLSNLAGPRQGTAMHEGSWDRKHQNDDALHLKAGETVTLFTHEGAGCVHQIGRAHV